jgi:hypothetical protein
VAISPVVKFHEFAVSGTNPSGSRPLTTHPSFVKELSTTAGEFLNFGSLNITNNKQQSETKAVVAFVTDMQDATEALFNLRFWLPTISDFTTGTFSFNGYASENWIQNIALTDSSGLFTPTVLPSGQNWLRQDGGTEITGSGDNQVTQFMYLGITFDTDVSNGVYGGDSGGFIYRLTFDFR